MSINLKHELLLVEDDTNLGIVVQDFLESSGFSVVLAETGAEAMKEFKSKEFDLAIFDVMLPDTDGITLAKEIRRKQPDLPLIFLTARNMPEDKIAGLKIGADDYITKPFDNEELKLRIDAVLRRYALSPNNTSKMKKYVKIGSFRFFLGQLLLKTNDQEIEVTATEAALISLLYEYRNELVTRELAFQRIWGVTDDLNSRNLDVYVGKLRKIFSTDSKIQIKSVHGKGYKFDF